MLDICLSAEVNMVKKVAEALKDLSWTLGGTGLVLITLSGDTLQWGLYISGAALVVHLACVALTANDDEETS